MRGFLLFLLTEQRADFQSRSRLFPGEEHTMDPFRWDFVGKNVTFMAVEGFIYFILNLLIQYRFFLDHW